MHTVINLFMSAVAQVKTIGCWLGSGSNMEIQNNVLKNLKMMQSANNQAILLNNQTN